MARGGSMSIGLSDNSISLQQDPEKWKPVFRKDHAPPNHDASLLAADSAALRRNAKRCNLPVSVRGKTVTYSIARGYLYGATVDLT
jgi:hypothetical protein